jgi:hypothetical protein
VPSVVKAGIFTVNVIETDPPPGMEKLDQAGDVAPTTGSVVAVRVAPPLSVIEEVDAYVNGEGAPGKTSVSLTPVALPYPAAFDTLKV